MAGSWISSHRISQHYRWQLNVVCQNASPNLIFYIIPELSDVLSHTFQILTLPCISWFQNHLVHECFFLSSEHVDMHTSTCMYLSLYTYRCVGERERESEWEREIREWKWLEFLFSPVTEEALEGLPFFVLCWHGGGAGASIEQLWEFKGRQTKQAAELEDCVGGHLRVLPSPDVLRLACQGEGMHKGKLPGCVLQSE